MRTSRVLTWTGVILVAISAYPMLLMAREIATGFYAGARYRVWPKYSSEATIGRHTMEA